MRRQLIIWTLCISALRVLADVNGIKYWFDTDFENAVSINSSSSDMPIDVSALPIGIHTLYVQAIGDMDYPVYSKVFTKSKQRESLNYGEVSSIEYWIDDDVESAHTYSGSSMSGYVEFKDIPVGMHTLNVQLHGQVAMPVYSKIFTKIKEGGFGYPELGNYKPMSICYLIDEDGDEASDAKFTTAESDGNVVTSLVDTTDMQLGSHKIKYALLSTDGRLSEWMDGNFLVVKSTLEEPIITHEDECIRMTTTAENADIYYALGTTDNTTKWLTYDEPISKEGNFRINAFVIDNSLNASKMVELKVDTFTCLTPNIMQEGNKLEITCPSPKKAKIYYTTNDERPDANSLLYIEPIIVTDDLPIRAIALADNYNASGVAEYVTSATTCESPEIIYNGEEIIINCNTNNSTIHYTLDNGELTDDWSIYETPISMKHNFEIKAVATREGLNPSNIKSLLYDEYYCKAPVINYNGRYVTVSAEEDDVVYYTTNGEDPDENSIIYDGGIDAGDYRIIKMQATNRYKKSSDVCTININSYYDGSTLKCYETGSINKALEWLETETLETLTIEGKISNDDIAILKSLPSIEHLDLRKVIIDEEVLQDRAFANMPNLRSIVMPEQKYTIGNSLFEGCHKLAAIDWTMDKKIPKSALDGIVNPDILLFVNTYAYAPEEYNTVSKASASSKKILLTDTEQSSFYTPYAFTAESITYTRDFQLSTVKGATAGWETICLPFNVQTYKHERGEEVAPFEDNRDEIEARFWLGTANDMNEFAYTSSMEAYRPYIISMPNNEAYASRYNLNGKITFSAKNVEVKPSNEYVVKVKDKDFVGMMKHIDKGAPVLLLNPEDYGSNPAGSIFVDGEYSSNAYHAFLRPSDMHSAPVRLSDLFADDTYVEHVSIEDDLSCWSRDRVLYIRSAVDREIDIRSMTGVIVLRVHTCPGVISVDSLPKGVYFIGNIKVLIK